MQQLFYVIITIMKNELIFNEESLDDLHQEAIALFAEKKKINFKDDFARSQFNKILYSKTNENKIYGELGYYDQSHKYFSDLSKVTNIKKKKVKGNHFEYLFENNILKFLIRYSKDNHPFYHEFRRLDGEFIYVFDYENNSLRYFTHFQRNKEYWIYDQISDNGLTLERYIIFPNDNKMIEVFINLFLYQVVSYVRNKKGEFVQDGVQLFHMYRKKDDIVRENKQLNPFPFNDKFIEAMTKQYEIK